MTGAQLSWVLYLVGSLLVFGSWVDIVPGGLGWTGWLMALGGWAVGTTDRRNGALTPLSRAEQLEKLQALRQQSVLSEDEFEREKRRVLDQPS